MNPWCHEYTTDNYLTIDDGRSFRGTYSTVSTSQYRAMLTPTIILRWMVEQLLKQEDAEAW